MTPAPRLALVASLAPEAQQAAERLCATYTFVDRDEADVIVALGGDGLMLRTLHSTVDRPVPVYGMNRGSLGWLMNRYRPDDLIERVARAAPVVLHPLEMEADTESGQTLRAYAFNEVSLYRQTHQSAKLSIKIDGVERLPELMADGLVVSTPAGSTAYNLSAGGPIVPLQANVLAVTPLSPFRPSRWPGALIRDSAAVTVDILEVQKRPVGAVADSTEVRNVSSVRIRKSSQTARLLFDSEDSLDDRVMGLQFG